MPETTTDPALRLAAKGRQVKPIYGENGFYIFPLPRGAGEAQIVSRTGAPTDIRPWAEDRRRLGVRIKRMRLRMTNDVREIPVDHPGLAEGWWDVELDGKTLRRWTKGDATLSLPMCDGPALLEIQLSDGLDYAFADQVETEPAAARLTA
jgi:hypothetical protein